MAKDYNEEKTKLLASIVAFTKLYGITNENRKELSAIERTLLNVVNTVELWKEP